MQAQATHPQQQHNLNNHNDNDNVNLRLGARTTTKVAARKTNRNLIIGGEIAPRGRFPYFSTLEHYCGGALIAPDVILTAGHCKPPRKQHVQPHVGRYTFLEEEKVGSGGRHTKYHIHHQHHQHQKKHQKKHRRKLLEENKDDDGESYDDTLSEDNDNSDTDEENNDSNDDDYYYEEEDEIFDIVASPRHPQWSALGDDEFVHDFTLLILNGTTDLPYIRINRDNNVPSPGQQVLSMGVGFTSNDFEHAQTANTLHQVYLNYLPNERCKLSNNTDDDDDNEEDIFYQGRIHHSHLCTTGGPNNERDSCAYDSGSPIIIPGDSPEDDLLVALVSWGEGCADPNFPGKKMVSYIV